MCFYDFNSMFSMSYSRSMQNYAKVFKCNKSNAKTYRKKQAVCKILQKQPREINMYQTVSTNVQNYAQEKLIMKSNQYTADTWLISKLYLIGYTQISNR